MSLPRVGAGPRHREPDDLEVRFGDPRVPGPFDYASIVADDEARRVSAAAEALLDEWDAAADFVPAILGGRWVSTEDLVRRWRPVFRRDPSLGMGHGLTTLSAVVNVWVAGDDEQRAAVAARLLRGERIAVGFDELDHGDLEHVACGAAFDGDHWRVTGVKQVVDNADRAESMLILARTSGDSDARTHTLLLWHRDAATGSHVDTARRVLTGGMRGRRLGTAEFDELPVPADRTVGPPGSGVPTARTASQVIRAVLPALAVATVDSSLELAVRYADDRSLYGGSVLDLPQSRALLAGAIADFLLADAFSSVVVRALHLAPEDCLIPTAASGYLVPQLLSSAMQDLSVLFGSTFYARVEPYDVFEKFLRDHAMLPIGHDGTDACRRTIDADLDGWLECSRRTEATDPAWFRLGARLGALAFDRLGLGAGSCDPLGAALRDPEVRVRFGASGPPLEALDRLADAYDAVRDEIDVAQATGPVTDTPVESAALVHRLALLLAAGAFAGVCAESGVDAITVDPLVREACLRRVEDRLAGRVGALEPHLVERLVAYAVDRTDRGIRLTISTRDDAPHQAPEEGDIR